MCRPFTRLSSVMYHFLLLFFKLIYCVVVVVIFVLKALVVEDVDVGEFFTLVLTLLLTISTLPVDVVTRRLPANGVVPASNGLHQPIGGRVPV